jgi:hypothetical protein
VGPLQLFIGKFLYWLRKGFLAFKTILSSHRFVPNRPCDHLLWIQVHLSFAETVVVIIKTSASKEILRVTFFRDLELSFKL